MSETLNNMMQVMVVMEEQLKVGNVKEAEILLNLLIKTFKSYAMVAQVTPELLE